MFVCLFFYNANLLPTSDDFFLSLPFSSGDFLVCVTIKTTRLYHVKH